MSKRRSQKQAARFVREQLARERVRRRRLILSAVAAAVLLAAGLVGWAVYVNQRPSGYQTPATATKQADGLTIGTGPATVEVYLDFQCPACRQFEDSAGATLDKLVADKKITLVYHPLAFLDRASTTRYSTRSAASAGCAADAGKLAPYVKVLYQRQKPEGGPGLSDDELVAAATSAGITDAGFATCLHDGKYAGWVTHVTDAAVQRGINATPTVFVNGKQVDATAAAVQAAVDAAAG